LDAEEVQLMKPLVRKYSLPFLTLMEVDIHKKLTREDSNTGRRVEFLQELCIFLLHHNMRKLIIYLATKQSILLVARYSPVYFRETLYSMYLTPPYFRKQSAIRRIVSATCLCHRQ
jgi:hypothetical protein